MAIYTYDGIPAEAFLGGGGATINGLYPVDVFAGLSGASAYSNAATASGYTNEASIFCGALPNRILRMRRLSRTRKTIGGGL